MDTMGVNMEVKPEPDMDDLDMADVDEVGGYEDDTGELLFPKNPPSGWLVRMPKDLWTMLAHLDDDEEVQIGEIRTWETKDQKGRASETVRFNLFPQIPRADLSRIPKQYDLTSSVVPPKNTFVFSERNVPNFKNRGIKDDPLRLLDSKEGPAKIEKRRGPRTIPKQTAYVGRLEREFVCTPRDNEEYRNIENIKRSKEPKKATELITDVKMATEMHMGGMLTGGDESSFINTGVMPTKRKAQENKATRMPELDLMDALQQLFREYKFWPMSSLKARLRQPEAWLKEVLSKIAVLVKNGTAANHYTLMPENQVGGSGSVDWTPEVMDMKMELAPEEQDVDLKDEEDEDDDMEFENA